MPRKKPMTDAEYIASLDALHGIAALEEFAASEFSNTSDPYYRDLNAALWRLFERALAEVKTGRLS